MSRSLIAIGIIIGFLFGFNGITMLFNLMGKALTEAQVQLSQMSAVSTLVLFIIAVILIIKVRILSSLIIGAISGAIINLILKLNGIDVLNIVYSEILSSGVLEEILKSFKNLI